jgi:hypothetical protein
MRWWSICPDNAVEFSESWAVAHTPPADRIDRVVLRQDSIRYIEEARDAFWGMPKKYDFRLEGMVRELETPEDARSGTAICRGLCRWSASRCARKFLCRDLSGGGPRLARAHYGVLRGRPGARETAY